MPLRGLTTIILTHNEEVNLPPAVASVKDISRTVIVVDSFSADRTVEVASSLGCKVYQNRFVDYSKQRNFALSLPIATEWVFFLDADERFSDALSREVRQMLEEPTPYNGFYVKRRLLWMGKWIRHGYYPVWILRLFRAGKAVCEERAINEHLVVQGPVGYLDHDLIHDDGKGISNWIDKHNRYAALEAVELLKQANGGPRLKQKFWGSQAERKRWIRTRVWNKLPPLLRPFLYFFYRYFLRLGFLDGAEGLVFHGLHALWFPFLIDCKYLELKRGAGKSCAE